MSEVGGTLIVELQEAAHRPFFEELTWSPDWAALKALAARFGVRGDFSADFEYFHGEDQWRPTIEDKSLDGNLVTLALFGEEWIDVCKLLQKAQGMSFWAVLHSEQGYDLYFGKSPAGVMRGTVAWEGGQDPAEDERQTRLRWYATMPDEIIARFVERGKLEEVLAAVRKHREAAAAKPSQWRRFFEAFGTCDGLVLKLRIKAKRRRAALHETLRAYIEAPSTAAFAALAKFMNESVAQCQPRADYPSFGPSFPGPLAVAKGMCFAVEEDDDLYVGFSLDDIGPYIHPDCNAYGGAEGMTHVVNMAEFFLLLCDKLSGSVCLANKGYCGKLWVHDGYIYLT